VSSRAFVCASLEGRSESDLEQLRAGGLRDNTAILNDAVRLLARIERAKGAGYTELWVAIPGGQAVKL